MERKARSALALREAGLVAESLARVARACGQVARGPPKKVAGKGFCINGAFSPFWFGILVVRSHNLIFDIKKTMRHLGPLLTTVFLLASLYGNAQQGKFKVNGFKAEYGCPIPFYNYNPKKSPEERYYDSRVLGYPRFSPGYLVMLTGEKVEGNIATFNDELNDWKFVKRCLLIVPTGEQEAQYIKNGVALISLQKKDEEVVYDFYKGAYLERLVSGKMRLSYNPDANTSKKVTDFVSPNFLDSMRANAGRRSIQESLQDGESIQASMEKAAAKDLAFQVGSAIEITEKEYLLFNESSGKTVLITKDNFEAVMVELFQSCPTMDAKTVKSFTRNYGNMVEAIKAYNSSCQ